ncbi:MAG: LuxR family transcriptional regulator [Rhizobium sp.]|nr:LuxR family transcriptional regulator [Rhizobium sp.]
MRLNEILRYLVTIGEVPTRDMALMEFEQLISLLGYRYYCVFHEPKPIENPAQLIIAANWDKRWIERYVANKYIVNDPTIRYLLKANRSFSWAHAFAAYQEHPHYRRMQKMIQDGKAHGLVSGHIFPVFGRTGLLGATTLGGPEEIDLSPVEIMLLETVTRTTYIKLLELEGSLIAEKVGDGADVMLTHREIQALSHMADGKTSPEIGDILKVAPTTVDWYGASVQEKMGARNRIHAVALAIRRGLIP